MENRKLLPVDSKVICNGEVDVILAHLHEASESYAQGYRYVLKENGTQSEGTVTTIDRLTIKTFDGKRDVNVQDYCKSLHESPSYARKEMAPNGTMGLSNCCYNEPSCGCKIVGCGTLQFPLTIQYCTKHNQM